MSSADYLELLPHRPPMRLIDEVLSVEPGVSASARRTTRADDFFFRGHFPGKAVVPAMILVELLAQTGGLAAHGALPGTRGSFRVAAFSGFKFPASAGVGAELQAQTRVVGRLGDLVKIEGQVSADGVIVARGGVTLVGTSGSDRGA